jgi:hypothetical protein
MDKHISPSQIESYLRCGESYRRRYLEKEIIPPSFAMHTGRAIHLTSQKNFEQKIESKIDLPKKEIQEISIENFKAGIKVNGIFLTEEETTRLKSLQNEAEQSTIVYASLYPDVSKKYQPKKIEISQKIKIPNSDYDLLGVIDLIDDEQKIIDIKTCSRSISEGDYDNSTQMTTYSLIHRALSGSEPNQLIIEALINKKVPETQTVIIPQRTKRHYEIFLLQIKEIINAITKGVFLPAQSNKFSWWCSEKSCGYWRTCKYIHH